MKRKLVLIILVISFCQIILAQTETYTVNKAFFSSDKYDEFSPVYYNKGIIFCSNRNLSLSNRSTSQNKGLFKIYYIDTTTTKDWKNAKLFSKSITTVLNDGPVTFNRGKDTIYYSRNQKPVSKLTDVSNPGNKLGIFYAVMVNGQWTKIRDLRINSDWYNITTPCLSPDGKRLYFASDKPDGYGGSDLYYSEWKNDHWNDPVNLGPVINTEGNESYPFITSSGELLFSSDGRKGFGGKDIFISRQSDTTWLTPVHLDAPINSEFDDFGIVSDSLMNSGYFSSNRDKTIDIYHFKTNIPQIFYSNIQKENQYCYIFRDSGSIVIDTLNLKYVWNFGDGKKADGSTVTHCYPGTGEYNVTLDIIDRSTGNLFFSKLRYKLEVKDVEQPYINSSDVIVKDESGDFDAYKSNLPGYKILSYSWDFGDGTREQGQKVKHSFNKSGEFTINLGLTLKHELTGKILKTGSSKKIRVLNDINEKSSYLTKKSTLKLTFAEVGKNSNAVVKSIYSADSDFNNNAVFQVELISSKTRIDLKGDFFKNVPKAYDVEEVYNSEAGTYSYVVDRQVNLMYTYITFKQLVRAGFKSACIKTEILTDPAEKEIYSIKKIFGTSADACFDSYSRLTSSAIIMLDQIIKLMNRYPDIKLEIGIHTDNTGSADEKLSLSKKYAQIINSYLIDKGVISSRLIPKGFGGSRPVTSNILEADRSLNRRIDFKIIR